MFNIQIDGIDVLAMIHRGLSNFTFGEDEALSLVSTNDEVMSCVTLCKDKLILTYRDEQRGGNTQSGVYFKVVDGDVKLTSMHVDMLFTTTMSTTHTLTTVINEFNDAVEDGVLGMLDDSHYMLMVRPLSL